MTIRILCLHGGGQSGNDLRCQLLPLEERLAKKHNVQLYFIDSPINGWISNDFDLDEGQRNRDVHRNNVAPRRTNSCEISNDRNLKWFEDIPTKYHLSLTSMQSWKSCNTSSKSVEENKLKSEKRKDEKKYQYIGLDASLLHVHQIWQRGLCSNPFHGVIAFHQGTVLTSILLLAKKLKNCEFVIFSSGFILNDPPPDRGCMGVSRKLFMHPSNSILNNTALVDSSSGANSCDNHEYYLNHKENLNEFDYREINNDILHIGNSNLKSLHLIGKRNSRVPPMCSRLLAKRFHNAHVYEHSFTNDYTFPNRSRDLNIIGKVGAG